MKKKYSEAFIEQAVVKLLSRGKRTVTDGNGRNNRHGGIRRRNGVAHKRNPAWRVSH
ncbi:hypothetical protein [Polaromonas sp. UBA4122]|uniref:hypothetical protein n=1 Tax=Polaromonas sp. UBA4122 TaxID=1947074 RepID=UPI002600EF81|nr:hypothetical protein [Polaromonas sp. UBA4122]